MTLGRLISRIVGIYLIVKGLSLGAQGFPSSGLSVVSFPWLLVAAGLVIAGAVLFGGSARLFEFTPPGADLDLRAMELFAFRVVGLLVLVEAVPLLAGSLISTIYALVSPPPRVFPGDLGDEAFRLRTFIGAGFSALAGILQLWLGLWLLLKPESLIGKIERWRGRRGLGYTDGDLAENTSKEEEN